MHIVDELCFQHICAAVKLDRDDLGRLHMRERLHGDHMIVAHMKNSRRSEVTSEIVAA